MFRTPSHHHFSKKFAHSHRYPIHLYSSSNHHSAGGGASLRHDAPRLQVRPPGSHHHRLFSLPATATLKTAKPMHALTITSGSNIPISLQNSLITAYASSGELSEAQKLFDKMPLRTNVSYNSIISAYSRTGHVDECCKLLIEMMTSGVRPTEFTFSAMLFSPSFDFCHGLQLHPLILKSGFLHAGPFSGTALLALLGRNGRIDDAVKLFLEMSEPSIVTWNSIIAACARQGLVRDSIMWFREFMRTGIGWSEYSFLSILSGFVSPDSSESGKQVHGLAIKSGMDDYAVVANALISMYFNCSDVFRAERCFISMPDRDVVSWNTMITVYVHEEMPDKALELFLSMSSDGFMPNETTFASVVTACTNLNGVEFGESVHAKVIKHNFATCDFVGSSLVNFYAKCKCLEDAHALFNEIPRNNIVCWNALILGYANRGLRTTLFLLKEMLQSSFRPNEVSFSAALKWCCASELRQLHSLIIKLGYDSYDYVSSKVIASYASLDDVSDALIFAKALGPSPSVAPTNTIAGVYNRSGQFQQTQNLLSQLEKPDSVSCNIMIAACARNGDYEEAFLLFKQMQISRNLPDNYMAVSLLSICTKLRSLHLGSLLHGLITKINFYSFDVFAHNVLLDMYAKCGCLENSLRIFAEMNKRNLITWTALVAALGLHGCAHEALEKFKQMESEEFIPDHVSFIAILSACRHSGLVEEGMSLFKRMKSVYGIEPEMDHYICVVDLLCRHGHLKEAEHVINSMPFQPNALIWRTFLDGYQRINKTHTVECQKQSESSVKYVKRHSPLSVYLCY